MSDKESPAPSSYYGSILHLVRVTLEAVTPISIGDADNAGESDVAIVRDANGLPTLPGPSIAEVIRHLFRKYGEGMEDATFGFILPGKDEGATSRVSFGWGCVHDSKGRAVEGLDFNLSDDLLVHLDTPVLREHVALSHRGVTARKEKFDRAGVPRGARFSFEVSMWGEPKNAATDKALLKQIVELTQHPAFRLGGASRRGYGACRIVGDADGKPLASHRSFDLSGPNSNQTALELRACRSTPPSNRDGFAPLQLDPAASGAEVIELILSPRGHWRVGAGEIALTPPSAGAEDKQPTPFLLLSEPWIEWTNGVGKVRRPDEGDDVDLLIPGSSVKGALAHRVLYHFNRLTQRFIDADSLKDAQAKAAALNGVSEHSERSEALAPLLGFAKTKEADGLASRLIVDDCIVRVPRRDLTRVTHNRIDRFTQGAMDGGLFAEELAFAGKWTIRLTILPGDTDADEKAVPQAREIRTALKWAIADLCEGRLALGARSMGFAEGVAQEGFSSDALLAAQGSTP